MIDEPQNAAIDVERLLAEAPIARCEYYASIASTHDCAHQRARAAEIELPLVIVADAQTAGRGRGQNQWWTGGGSLAFNVIFDPKDWRLPEVIQPQRSLAAGVAVVDAVGPLVPGYRIGLHWPNDVFVDERKLAGLLVDVLAGGRHIVGIGLNVNNSFAGAPAEVAQRAVSLTELTGQRLDRTTILVEILCQLQQAMQASAANPAGFGTRFQSLCLQAGRELTIETAGRRTTGVCAGIAPDGALLLEVAGQLTRHYSGILRHDV
jgi:BirA family biotin operon repressor/biotin-[acetyl-CoA-carboxylase] ligase